MILLRRIVPLLLGVGLVLFAADRRWGDASALWDPRAFVMTLVIPWVALACTDSVRAARSTFTEGLLLSPREAPPERLRRARARLRYLAGATMAAGIIAGLFAFVSEVNHIAMSRGQADVGVWPRFAAGLLLGPLYGVLFKVFLYDATASALMTVDADMSEVFE